MRNTMMKAYEIRTSKERCPNVVAKMLNCNLVISEFKLQ